METDLISLPNIGKDTEAKLVEAGIHSCAELIETGTEQTFLRLQSIDPGACIQLLYGIDGAVQGIPATKLSHERKQQLKEFLRMTKLENKPAQQPI
ncbi:MAG TPA: TfoX/Sxy family protein [Paludibacter sp.]|nr:TfoX/Sxy family protein [Paludibacter sp.]